MIAQDVRWLQVENSTKCNAWCPACARNNDGYGLSPNLTIEDLDLVKFEQVLQSFPNLQTVQFCGTYGDFAAAANATQHLKLSQQYADYIQIHTHGGIRNTAWWSDLAHQLKSHKHNVWFALDGLKGVHEIYRQGTDFNKTIDNAQAFIAAGGHATWQFIPWAHNEHQLMDCMRLSQQLGFKQFRMVKNVRDKFEGRHWQTGNTIEFAPWSKNQKFSKYQVIGIKTHVEKSNCMHLSLPSVYLNANGTLSSCCEFNTADSHSTFNQLPDIQHEHATNPRLKCLLSCGSVATSQDGCSE